MLERHSFQEVIKQMKRMCAYFKPTCNGCPLGLEKDTYEFCGEEPLDIRSDPALVEAAVMRWAAEHPEPVYPTWGEWLGTKYGYDLREILYTPISADIAQKLGIEPKEG